MVQIKTPFNKESFIKAQNFKRKIIINPLVNNTIGYLIAGTILIVLNENNSNNQISFALSWIAIAFGILSLIQLIKARIKYHKMVRNFSERFEREQMDCEYRFDENGISYCDKEKSFSCKWELLQGYSLFKPYLIFHVLGKNSCDIILDRSHFTEEEFDILDGYLVKSKQVII